MNIGGPAKCSACGADAIADGVCGRCGYANGDANRCPHCAAVARVEPKGSGPSLCWVCGVCGGPRMPSGLGGEAAMIPLREAKASQSRAARLRAVFWAFLTIALFAMMIAMIAWPAALAGKLLWLAFAVTPMAIAVRSRARASKATGDANEALDRAWLAAAEDATSQAKKGVTVAELAARLKIDAVKAEKLLTQLAVHDRTRIDVGDDAEVRYSMTPEIDTSKVRVASSEDAFLALEEAEAASERREQQRLQDEDEAKKLATAPFGRGPAR